MGSPALLRRKLASLTHSRASTSCAERRRRASSEWAPPWRISFSTKSLIDPQGDQIISARLFKAVLCATSWHLPLPWFGKKKKKKHSPPEWKDSQCKVMCSYHFAQMLCFVMFSLAKLKHAEKDNWLQNPLGNGHNNFTLSGRYWRVGTKAMAGLTVLSRFTGNSDWGQWHVGSGWHAYIFCGHCLFRLIQKTESGSIDRVLWQTLSRVLQKHQAGTFKAFP